MFDSTTVIQDGLSDVLREQAGALAEHLDGARQGHVRDVHQARVASRRLREALPVAVRAAPDACVPGTRGQVRRLTVALGGVREMDVARETFAKQCEQHGWRLPLVRRVQTHLDRERNECGRRMEDHLARVDVPGLEASIVALAGALEDRPAVGWQRVLATRLRRRADRFTNALDDVGTLYAADRLHKVRIAAKKLRYTLELGAKAARLTVGREIAMLKRVQELLGRLHDLQILQSHVQAVAAGSGSDVRLTRALGGILATFETDCRTLHAVFLARRQKLLDLAARVRQVAAVPRDATPNVGHEAPARMLRMRALVKRRVS